MHFMCSRALECEVSTVIVQFPSTHNSWCFSGRGEGEEERAVFRKVVYLLLFVLAHLLNPTDPQE